MTGPVPGWRPWILQWADFVAKVYEGRLARNNRIRTAEFSNQCCESVTDFESKLLTWRPKIVLHTIAAGDIMRRRNFLRLAAGATMMPVMPGMVRARTYPSRPLRILVPWRKRDTTPIEKRSR
jgi:hypothetical protein